MTIWLWTGFLVLVALFLALDLGVLNRRDHEIGAREALAWTAVWIGLSMMFAVLVYFMYDQHWFGIGTAHAHKVSGREAAVQYVTGYLVEKSLSLDNIFVIALVFRHFQVPLKYQHRVLFWGIIGALLMRGAMIGAGVVLIEKFSWAIYVFGAFLIFTAIRMLVSKESAPDLENSRLVRVARRLYPVTGNLVGHRFFALVDGRRAITPLFLVLLIVETSDVVFAVDSIPAIFAITTDPFLVFTSNIFAILGLRSLYFALAQLLHRFYYLQYSLVVILAYVGVKMIVSEHFPIPAPISLAVIMGVLVIGIVASIIKIRLGAKTEGEEPSSK
jgi:tellurite resistance protein TerC